MAPLRKCIYLNVNTLRVGTRASRLHNGDHRREEDAPAGQRAATEKVPN